MAIYYGDIYLIGIWLIETLQLRLYFIKRPHANMAEAKLVLAVNDQLAYYNVHDNQLF